MTRRRTACGPFTLTDGRRYLVTARVDLLGIIAAGEQASTLTERLLFGLLVEEVKHQGDRDG